jgi:hypothetical protein
LTQKKRQASAAPLAKKPRKSPVKFDARRQDVFLDVYRTSGSHAAASKAAGVTRQTVYNETVRNPDFKGRFLEARTEIEAILADELIRRSLVTSAKGQDTTALIFALKNLRPDRWSDRRRVDLTSGDGSMTPREAVVIQAAAPADIAEIRAMFAEAVRPAGRGRPEDPGA